MKINIFWGDLNEISAKQEALYKVRLLEDYKHALLPEQQLFTASTQLYTTIRIRSSGETSVSEILSQA